MTSEYMHTYDASLDDEFGEKTVSILLDGEESEMIFIDHPSSEMSVSTNQTTKYNFHKIIFPNPYSTGGKLALDLRTSCGTHRVFYSSEKLIPLC